MAFVSSDVANPSKGSIKNRVFCPAKREPIWFYWNGIRISPKPLLLVVHLNVLWSGTEDDNEVEMIKVFSFEQVQG